MTTETQIEKRGPAACEKVEPNACDATYLPEVDIREDNNGVEVVADMPGVDKSGVEVTVENGVLSIAAEAREEAPEGYTPARREFRVGRYRRDFTLSDQIDASAIKAHVADGVVTVSLPKRVEAKPHKIEVTS